MLRFVNITTLFAFRIAVIAFVVLYFVNDYHKPFSTLYSFVN